MLATCVVVAAPSRGADEVHITATGDFGATANTSAVLTKIKSLNPDASIALGDFAYGDVPTEAAWCAFVKQRVGEGFPFELLSGNHESHDLAQGLVNNYSACLPNQVPGLVGTYGREYYIDLPKPTPLVRMIQASPFLTFENGLWNYQQGDAHYTWLSNAIDDARSSGIKWVVVSAHIPCLSVGIYNCPAPRDFYNLLMSKRVDLVLNGHEHAYMRTHQLRAGVTGCTTLAVGSFDADCVADSDNSYSAGAGTVFATVGTGGKELRNINSADTEGGYFASWSGLNANPTFGLLDLRFTDDKLTAAFVGTSGGNHQDGFTVTRTGQPVNSPPTAAFTASASQRAVAVDGASSSDADGSIASYAWDFGDGASGSGVSANHTYAADGTYTIRLTVTDNLGATGTVTKAVSVSGTPPAAPVTLTLGPTADAYVRSDLPSSNFGSLNQFYSRGPAPELLSYLAFDLPPAPAGTTLAGASLTVRTTTTVGSGSPGAHRVSLAQGAWSEGAVTYANRPTVTGTVLGELAAGSADDAANTIALSPAALQGRLGGSATLALTSAGTTDVLQLWSKEFVVASYRPTLTLTFTPTP